MNNRFIKILILASCGALSIASCGSDNSSFESSSTSDSPTNNGLISQNNFTILFAPTRPQYFDVENGTLTSVTSEISVQIGDNNNQVITESRTIRFRTEWGLIDPSCTTENGTCSVTWRSGSPDDMPSNFRNHILAYSLDGQESFDDFDGNGMFNDGDNFDDLEEPFVDVNESGSFDSGDIIIDTINGRDPTGADATHNDPDGFFNGPDCSHSSQCSATQDKIAVWEGGSLLLTGDAESTVGGAVSGLTGTLDLQNNEGDTLNITADGTFAFATSLTPGTIYNVTVLNQPDGQICDTIVGMINTGVGMVVGDVTSITVTCM